MEFGLPLAVLVAVVVWSLLLVSQRSGIQADVDAANRKVEELRPTVARVLELDRQIATMRERENIVAALKKQQLPAAAVLNEVRLLIPKEVWVVTLSVPDTASLSLEGLALNYYAVARLMDNLAAGQLLNKVDLSVVQTEKIGPTEVVRFQVTARISRPQASGGGRQ